MGNDDKQESSQPAPEHHSKAKGAAVGAAAGDLIAGKKGAAIGAIGGALHQHHKNEKEEGEK